jgi:indole-3-glycerol phosphate synthase
MRTRIPSNCLVVGESGIHGRSDAILLEKAGVDAMLVGEHLMAQPDIGTAVRQLLGR